MGSRGDPRNGETLTEPIISPFTVVKINNNKEGKIEYAEEELP